MIHTSSRREVSKPPRKTITSRTYLPPTLFLSILSFWTMERKIWKKNLIYIWNISLKIAHVHKISLACKPKQTRWLFPSTHLPMVTSRYYANQSSAGNQQTRSIRRALLFKVWHCWHSLVGGPPVANRYVWTSIWLTIVPIMTVIMSEARNRRNHG